MGQPELDPELLRRCLQGDPTAMGAFYDCYQQRVFYLARRMIGEHDAEDVCQEIFIAAFRALAKFRGESKVSTWLLGLSTRVCLMHLRKHRNRMSRLEPLQDTLAELADTLSPGLEVAQRDFWKKLSAAIDSLPASQRAAITLRSLEEMSYEEIARAMELDVERVRATLFRARRTLIDRLKEES